MSIPLEFKYGYAMGGWTEASKELLLLVREKYGAAAALEIFDMVCNEGERVKKLTTAIRTLFNLEENDAETLGEVLDIWDEFTGIDSTILDRSNTINRRKVTKCPWVTAPRDLSEWFLPFYSIVTKTINPKATLERPKAMCAGDPYCEYTWKIEE